MRATSFEEVSAGRLNNPEERFPRAIELTRQTFSDMLDNELIVGATIFGSAVSSDELQQPEIDPLSDLDAVIIFNDKCRDSWIRRTLTDAAADVLGQTAVGLEISWVNEADAVSGDHPFLPTIHRWLKQQSVLYPEMTIGRAPAGLLKPLEVDVIAAVDSWFRDIRFRNQKTPSSCDAAVTWALSAPHVAARKSIDALRYCDTGPALWIPPPLSPHYTKDEVAGEAYYVYGRYDQRFWELYHELRLIKQGFLGFLMNVVPEQEVSPEAYDNTLLEFAIDAQPKAQEVLQRMHRKFLQLGKLARDNAL